MSLFFYLRSHITNLLFLYATDLYECPGTNHSYWFCFFLIQTKVFSLLFYPTSIYPFGCKLSLDTRTTAALSTSRRYYFVFKFCRDARTTAFVIRSCIWRVLTTGKEGKFRFGVVRESNQVCRGRSPFKSVNQLQTPNIFWLIFSQLFRRYYETVLNLDRWPLEQAKIECKYVNQKGI